MHEMHRLQFAAHIYGHLLVLALHSFDESCHRIPVTGIRGHRRRSGHLHDHARGMLRIGPVYGAPA
jgi:hypothetical protein